MRTVHIRRSLGMKPFPSRIRAVMALCGDQQRQISMSDETRDSNGTILADGDNVTVIKDLKVKGTSSTIKRGTLVKGIRLTGNPDEVECRVAKIKGLVLRTEFLKKA